MPFVKSNGIRLCYQITGAGHPLLFIAGVGYGQWFWRKIVPGLAKRYQVMTFDSRGAGETDKPAGPYWVSMMAADAAGLLDTLDVTSAYVVGHSLGGFIAQELAVTRPELIGKLVLASTTFGGGNTLPITAEAIRVLTDRSGDPLELIRRGIGIACAPGFAERQPAVVDELVQYRLTNPVPAPQYAAQVAAGAATAAFTDDMVDQRTAAIRVPTLILFGEHDNVVPAGNAALMAVKITGAKTKILPGVGHVFPIEDAAATVKALEEFFGT